MPIATLASAWPELVGERLAEATQPVSLEGGVLTVRATDGPWGSQARYLAEEIRERADEALGGGVRSVAWSSVDRSPTNRETAGRRADFACSDRGRRHPRRVE